MEASELLSRAYQSEDASVNYSGDQPETESIQPHLLTSLTVNIRINNQITHTKPKRYKKVFSLMNLKIIYRMTMDRLRLLLIVTNLVMILKLDEQHHNQ